MKLSNIPGDEAPIVGVYGPSFNDLKYVYKCRGREVSRTKITDQDSHGKYRYCMFCDTGQWAWINEENLRGFQRQGVGLIEVINHVEEAA